MSDVVVEDLFAKLRLQPDGASFRVGNDLIQGIKRGLLAVAAAGLAVKTLEWASGIVSSTVEAGFAIERLSERLGITVDDLGGFEAAAQLAGASGDDMATGMQHLARTITEAKQGSKEAQQALANVGLSMSDAAVQSGDLGAATLQIADHFKAMPDGAAKVGASMGALGRGGAALIPLFNKGSEGIREAAQEADNFGAILHGPALDALNSVHESQERLSLAWQGAKNTIAVALAPALSNLAGRLGDYLAKNHEIIQAKLEHAFYLVGEALKTVGDVIGDVVDGFESVSDWIEDAFPDLDGFKTLITAVGVAMAAAWVLGLGPLGPLILAVGAVTGASTGMFDAFANGHPIIAGMIGFLKELGDELRDIYDKLTSVSKAWDAAHHIGELNHAENQRDDLNKGIETRGRMLAEMQQTSAAGGEYTGYTLEGGIQKLSGVDLDAEIQRLNDSIHGIVLQRNGQQQIIDDLGDQFGHGDKFGDAYQRTGALGAPLPQSGDFYADTGIASPMGVSVNSPLTVNLTVTGVSGSANDIGLAVRQHVGPMLEEHARSIMDLASEEQR